MIKNIFTRNSNKIFICFIHSIFPMYHYIYNITRYGEITTTITRDTFTDDETEIMSFYDQEITIEDRNRIIESYNKGDLNDRFDYILDNLINRKPNCGPCTYKELMGDCKRLRRVVPIISSTNPNHYVVLLES